MAHPLFSWLFQDESNAAYVDLMAFRSYRDFDAGIIECTNGDLMCGWHYTGVDHESASGIELNHLSLRLNDLMKSLGRGWVMWNEALRVETNDYPAEEDCHFPDSVSLQIDRERRTAVQEQEHHFETVSFFVLMYKQPSRTAQKLYNTMIDEDETAKRLTLEEKQDRYFRKVVAQFEGALDSIFPCTRLGGYTDEAGHTYCDFARLLHYCATGIMRPVRVPDPSVRLDCLIAGQEFIPSFTPVVGNKYIGVVSAEGPQAASTEPALMAAFDSRPLAYRWSTRFIFMDRVEAVESLTKFHRKWSQQVVPVKDQLAQNPNPRINRDAQRMVDDAAEARAEVSSGDVSNGFYTSVFVVYSEDLDEVQDACDEFKKLLEAQGLGGRVEQMNATAAFLGSIPGNTGANVAKIPISTANLSDLMPVASAWPGDEFCPSDKFPPYSPPLIQAETPTSTPFRFNTHVRDLGHFAVFGMTRSGKSTLLCLMMAQWLKYKDAQVFAFDVDMSMYAITKGVGGNHFEIGAEDASGFASVTFMPLQHIDTAADRAWAVNWVETCVELQGVTITPAHHNAIDTAMKLLEDSNSRTITEFVSNLQNRELTEAMQYYVIGGTAGYILDGATETAVFSNFNVFELRQLMQMGSKVIIPTLTYIFRCIERSLDGRPTLIPVDECWLAFANPTIRDKLWDWLKTTAKKNACVGLATQSIVDAIKSGIVETILDSTATKILLPSPEIGSTANRPFYESTLGLNPREIDLLIRGRQKKQYYYTSSMGRRMFELNLRPKTLAWVGRSTPDDVVALKGMIEDYPDDWMDRWVEHCTT